MFPNGKLYRKALEINFQNKNDKILYLWIPATPGEYSMRAGIDSNKVNMKILSGFTPHDRRSRQHSPFPQEQTMLVNHSMEKGGGGIFTNRGGGGVYLQT